MVAAAHLCAGDLIDNPTPSDEPNYDSARNFNIDTATVEVVSTEPRSELRDPDGTRRFVRLRHGGSRVWFNTRLVDVIRR